MFCSASVAEEVRAEGNGTVISVPEVIPAELRMNDDYVFYYNNLAKLVITGVIPFVSLCFFNFKIYSSLRRRRNIMGPAATAAHQQQLNEDNRQALVLFSIVIIFLVTNSPRIFINIDEVSLSCYSPIIVKQSHSVLLLWVEVVKNIWTKSKKK